MPVKPTKEALGSASRMWRAKPSTKSYLAAVGFVGDDHDVCPLRQGGMRVAGLPGEGDFWMVVKTTPPDSTASLRRRSARLSACVGGWRSRSLQREKVPKSWSSRSLRSVRTTTVGLRMAGSRMTAPA